MGGWGGRDGGSPGHFDRANCLNPQALFALLCTVPRRYSPLLRNVSLALHLPFNPYASAPAVAFGRDFLCRNYRYHIPRGD